MSDTEEFITRKDLMAALEKCREEVTQSISKVRLDSLERKLNHIESVLDKIMKVAT